MSSLPSAVLTIGKLSSPPSPQSPHVKERSPRASVLLPFRPLNLPRTAAAQGSCATIASQMPLSTINARESRAKSTASRATQPPPPVSQCPGPRKPWYTRYTPHQAVSILIEQHHRSLNELLHAQSLVHHSNRHPSPSSSTSSLHTRSISVHHNSSSTSLFNSFSPSAWDYCVDSPAEQRMEVAERRQIELDIAFAQLVRYLAQTGLWEEMEALRAGMRGLRRMARIVACDDDW